MVDGETGEEIRDKDGNICQTITSPVTYKENPDTQNMTVSITLPGFDSNNYLGKKVVVYEEVYWNNNIYMKDYDLNNTRESVYFPYIIQTKASGENGESVIPLQENICIFDSVEYSGLAPEKEYTITGTLHYIGEDNKEVTLKNRSGEDIKAETTFVAKQESGTQQVVFNVRLSDVMIPNLNCFPNKLVVYEDLSYNGQSIYLHGDINDTAQTVSFPTLSTSLVEEETQIQFLSTFHKEITIVDHVEYHNLTVGNHYTLIGKLIDKETGKPIVENGKPVQGMTTFEAIEKSGMVDVEFEFDGSTIWKDAKKTGQVVAYEYLYDEFDVDSQKPIQTQENYCDLYEDTQLLSAHADINNTNQTICVVELKSKAMDKSTGTQEGKADKNTTIVDTVTYEHLIPGKEYTLKGKIMLKETNKPFTVDEKEIVSEVTFTAEKENGSIPVEFHMDSSTLQNQSIVIYEELYMDQIKIAEHTDLNDKNQTITFPPEKTPPIKTGDMVNIRFIISCFISSIFVAGACCYIITRKKRRR